MLLTLGSSLGGKEIDVEAGEYLPRSLTFRLPERRRRQGLCQEVGITETQHSETLKGQEGRKILLNLPDTCFLRICLHTSRDGDLTLSEIAFTTTTALPGRRNFLFLS